MKPALEIASHSYSCCLKCDFCALSKCHAAVGERYLMSAFEICEKLFASYFLQLSELSMERALDFKLIYEERALVFCDLAHATALRTAVWL